MEDLDSKSLEDLKKGVEVTVAHRNHAKLVTEHGVSAIATTICQTPLFITQMVGALGFDAAGVWETTATMYRAKETQHIEAMKAMALEEGDSKDESLERVSLQVAAARF